MSSILRQIAAVEIQQILALSSAVSNDQSLKLHKQKMDLINRLHQERLLYHVDQLIKPNWIERIRIRIQTFSTRRKQRCFTLNNKKGPATSANPN